MRVQSVNSIATDIAGELLKSGGADDLLNDAAQAAGFDGFSRMISMARRGQRVLAWFTPDRIALFAGLGIFGITALVARPGTAALAGLGGGVGTFIILKTRI